MINLEPAGLDALIKYCELFGLDATEILRQAAIDRINGVEREPVVHAHWITDDDDFWACSNCMKYIPKDCAHGYCPKCGARMGGEEECY